MSSDGGCVVLPGGVFVVFGAGFEAAVQDADEPVRELTKRGVVTDLPGSQGVVVGPRTRRRTERGKRLLVKRVAEPTVGGVPGQHDGLLPRRPSDRALPGVVLPGPGVDESFLVIAELTQRPAARTTPRPGWLR